MTTTNRQNRLTSKKLGRAKEPSITGTLKRPPHDENSLSELVSRARSAYQAYREAERKITAVHQEQEVRKPSEQAEPPAGPQNYAQCNQTIDGVAKTSEMAYRSVEESAKVSQDAVNRSEEIARLAEKVADNLVIAYERILNTAEEVVRAAKSAEAKTSLLDEVVSRAEAVAKSANQIADRSIKISQYAVDRAQQAIWKAEEVVGIARSSDLNIDLLEKRVEEAEEIARSARETVAKTEQLSQEAIARAEELAGSARESAEQSAELYRAVSSRTEALAKLAEETSSAKTITEEAKPSRNMMNQTEEKNKLANVAVNRTGKFLRKVLSLSSS
jgi:hypothetical protein